MSNKYEKYKAQIDDLDDLREGYELMSGKKKRDSGRGVYISLSSIMNTYEINLILSKFLQLWSRDADIPYIRVPLLISTFKLYDFGIVEKFFPDGCAYANQFFQFVCAVSFFDLQQINLLIFSKCKILSNYMITHEQVMSYMDVFDKEHDCDLTVFFHDYLIDIPDTKMIAYSLKAFTQYINENKIIENNFNKLKITISREIFPRSQIEKIFRRYQFYTDKNYNKLDKPKESCFEKLKRRINNEPPPYHFDYCINKSRSEYSNSNTNYIDILVYMMKQSSGYGYRSSGSKVKIQRSNSSINQSIDSNVNNINNLVLHNNNNNNSNSRMTHSVRNLNLNNTINNNNNNSNNNNNNNIVMRNSISLSLKDRLNENKSRFDTRSRSFLTATIKSNTVKRSITIK